MMKLALILLINALNYMPRRCLVAIDDIFILGKKEKSFACGTRHHLP